MEIILLFKQLSKLFYCKGVTKFCIIMFCPNISMCGNCVKKSTILESLTVLLIICFNLYQNGIFSYKPSILKLFQIFFTTVSGPGSKFFSKISENVYKFQTNWSKTLQQYQILHFKVFFPSIVFILYLIKIRRITKIEKFSI